MPQNNDPRYIATKKILDDMDGFLPLKLFKTTRAGATTGLTANCIDADLVPLLIAPTKKISHETIKDSIKYSQQADANIQVLLSNHECLLNKRMIREYPDVAKLPILPLPMKCSKCKQFEMCPVTSLIRSLPEDVDGIGITYQKLQAIMFSDSEVANMIKGRLAACDVIIFDEAHIFESPDTVSIQVYPYQSLHRYQTIFKDNSKILPFLETYEQLIHDKQPSIMQLVHEHDDAEKNLMSIVLEDSVDTIDFKSIIGAIKEIIKIMKNREEYNMSVDDVMYISNIIMLFAADKHVLHYIKSKEASGVFLSNMDSLLPAVRMFKSMIDPTSKKKVIFTTATFGDFDYMSIFGFHDDVMMDDVMNANQKMTIYPDTIKIDDINYRAKYWDRIVNAAQAYNEKYPGIVFVCMKKDVAWWLQNRLSERGIEINVDYYRSDRMIGVSSDDRQCVCVGAPVMPINAYDGVSDTYKQSQKKRVGNNHAAFWQAISRFKSPSGTQDTQIFCIGITQDVIEKMITWGTDRKLTINNLLCKNVEVDVAFESPIVIDDMQEKLRKLLKTDSSVGRTYLLQRLNITAKELDALLVQDNMVKHVKMVTKKTKRKPKKSYIWVE